MKEIYDKEEIYDAQIAPLMDGIIKLCDEHRIPMVATFAYRREASDDGDEEGIVHYCTTARNTDDDHLCPRLLRRLNSIAIRGDRAEFAAFAITTAQR